MRILIGIAYIVVLLAVLLAISLVYEWLRKKINRPAIGFSQFLCNIIKRDDYVSINGKIYRFSHFTQGGEALDSSRPPFGKNTYLHIGDLAFYNPHGLGYYVVHKDALIKCDFIYGKYGLKWASKVKSASIAKEQIESFYD